MRQRKYILTTQSRHDLPVFRNLAATMKLTGINQLWVADITYIRLREQFLFLAVVLDAYSRRVVGWSLDDTLQLAGGECFTQCDRGTQTRAGAGASFRSRMTVCRATSTSRCWSNTALSPSMSRAGNPYDNARCESFIKTLKAEEIYTRQYRDRADLGRHMEAFLEQYYNYRRLHSALGYRSPASFEQSMRLTRLASR